MLLRQWRRSRELSQWEASQILLIDPRELSKLERGNRPGLKAALAIEEATGGVVPPSAWLDEIEHDEPPDPDDNEQQATGD